MTYNFFLNYLIQQGYIIPSSSAQELSGWHLVEYFLIRAERYGYKSLFTSLEISLQDIFTRIIYDGMAYEQFIVWAHDDDYDYYSFRKVSSETLDTSFLLLISDSVLLDSNLLPVRQMFKRLEALKQHIPDTPIINCTRTEQERFFSFFHRIGRLIFRTWASNSSPRYWKCNKLFDGSFLDIAFH